MHGPELVLIAGALRSLGGLPRGRVQLVERQMSEDVRDLTTGDKSTIDIVKHRRRVTTAKWTFEIGVLNDRDSGVRIAPDRKRRAIEADLGQLCLRCK